MTSPVPFGEWREESFKEGAKDWCRGDPMPDWPRRTNGVEFFYWLGYMRARAHDFFRRRDMALYPDTIEPRPLARHPLPSPPEK